MNEPRWLVFARAGMLGWALMSFALRWPALCDWLSNRRWVQNRMQREVEQLGIRLPKQIAAAAADMSPAEKRAFGEQLLRRIGREDLIPPAGNGT